MGPENSLRRAASSTCSVPPALIWKVAGGSRKATAPEDCAARCTTASGWSVVERFDLAQVAHVAYAIGCESFDARGPGGILEPRADDLVAGERRRLAQVASREAQHAGHQQSHRSE